MKARVIRQDVIARDPYSYSAHPHISVAPDGSWLVVYNNTVRGPHILHPPHDPRYRNMLTRSRDGGVTWEAAEVVPGYEWSGVECAAISALSNGELMLNQWQFDWVPLGRALAAPPGTYQLPEDFCAEMIASGELDTGPNIAAFARGFTPWGRGKGRAFVHFSSDCGRSWGGTREIGTGPYSGGYGLRCAAELADGTLVLPLNDIPDYQRIFVAFSRDFGRSWSDPVHVAWSQDHLFTEPAIVRLEGDELLVLFRDDVTRTLFSARSADGGLNWSGAAPTGIEGYPPHLLRLHDGALLRTYGHRRPDFSIRAVLSLDGGRTWDTDRTITISGGLPNKDLGYPATVETGPGAFYTVYYRQDEVGITGIEGTAWSLIKTRPHGR